MKRRWVISVSVFTVLCLAAVPVHLQATKSIVDRQTDAFEFDQERFEGFDAEEKTLLDEWKFKPREYIKRSKTSR
ncbi:hypothetical protein CR205_09130 [Alteribacter lacisalsi]|uniref:Uncharacterized protein n=1 Tax=Alteribacter lacisalsi TaxID=2045244 RepID=A0A2W0HPB4_9BACI|nr:hypothetical protein [Alteribacter lacisalsi]PYZ98719.1 hypothetical protein CR205_09130 [Alteribacter lacisalsi]